MSALGIYIYGFVSNARIDALKDILMQSGVYAIEYKKISALVSDTRESGIEGLEKESLGKLLIDHQLKIEKINAAGCDKIVPMKFGTIVSSGNDIYRILEGGYDVISSTIDAIKALHEMDVVARWSDFGNFINKIASNAEIVSLKNVMAHQDACEEVDMVSIGRAIKKKVDEKNSKARKDILKALIPICKDYKKQETLNDEMVINAAFLIESSEKERFIDAVEQTDLKYADELGFKIVGPLPCYSFYTIECKAIEKSDVESAMRCLEIEVLKSESDIKKAYRAMASVSHPDSSPEKANADSSRFIEIHNSYKLLMDYSSATKKYGLEMNALGADPVYVIKIKE